MSVDRTPRRGFLARMLAAGAAIGASSVPRAASASPTLDDEPWMRALSGKHRVIFHSHEPTGALAFRWAATYLDTQKASYGLRDADSSVVVGLNGKSIGLVFNDALWAKYPIGETLAMPGSTNPSGPRGNGAVAALLARGVIVLVCNNSLRASGQRFLPEAARNDNAARTAFYDEAKDKLLPGVQLVPAMIVTLQQAQDRGCRYVYAGG
jgi:intracellular sulfur oxidation DsrE/DsrF family protein